ncbi:MAG: hypothetical protein IK083_08990 [Abditibacteriota bacterium]|nr:hypothetical protein [Abditibacteriota bacterium]
MLVKKRDGKNPLFESRVAPPEGSSATAAKKDAAPAKPLPKPGSLLTIGSYPQKGLLGRQPLRWRVLETFGDDKLLVVTETVIDTMPFHKERPPKERAAQKVTWENSDIRKWLNEEFFDKTFSTGEKKRIYTTSIECGPYTNGCVGCYRTEDRVFLLSSGDAERYFIDNADRVCIPTGYARKRRIFTDKVGGRCWWWLRSSTKADHTVVDYIGGISESAEPSAMNIFGVRPAMVIRYPK